MLGWESLITCALLMASTGHAVAAKNTSLGSKGTATGTCLSESWYSDVDFSGKVTPAKAVDVSLLVRYAGTTECYRVSLDAGKHTARIIEHHYAKSRELASAHDPSIAPGKTVGFHITSKADVLTATIGSSTITYDQMLIPSGRVGLSVVGGQVNVSVLSANGEPSKDYAFHWNYSLPEKLRQQPMWKYLDQEGESLLTRYPSPKSIDEFAAYRKKLTLGLRRQLDIPTHQYS